MRINSPYPRVQRCSDWQGFELQDSGVFLHNSHFVQSTMPCHATMISVPVGGIEWFVVSPLCHDQSLVYFYTFFYFTLYYVLRTPTPYAHRIHGYTENRHHF